MNATSTYHRLKPAERRDQILDVANTLFAERGYEEVSVEDIARAAGVTRGLVHHYFGGRTDVYLALLERLGAMREEAIAKARGTQRPRTGGGLRLALAGLDRGEQPDLSRHCRTR